MEKHAALFDLAPDEEFGHGHYSLWREFHTLAEGILNQMLAELEGSLHELEKAVDRRMERRARGPRDASERQVLNALLAFESFEQFAQMMRNRAREEDEEVMADAQPKRITYQNRSRPRTPSPPPSNAADGSGGGGDAGVAGQLKGMGFSDDAVMIAIMQHGENFEECLQWLFENPGVGESEKKSDGRGSGGAGGQVKASGRGANDIEGYDPAAFGEDVQGEAGGEDVDDYGGGGGDGGGGGGGENEETEMQIQIGMAQSILDAEADCSLPEVEKGLIPWALAMKSLAVS